MYHYSVQKLQTTRWQKHLRGANKNVWTIVTYWINLKNHLKNQKNAWLIVSDTWSFDYENLTNYV